MTILHYIRRLFRRRPAQVEYVRETDLPADADELIRAGVITPWRVEAATGERWFSADIGAIQWYRDNLGGHRDV
jgi:hypothetical protein